MIALRFGFCYSLFSKKKNNKKTPANFLNVLLYFSYRNKNSISIYHQLFQNHKSAVCFPYFTPVISQPTGLCIALRQEDSLTN